MMADDDGWWLMYGDSCQMINAWLLMNHMDYDDDDEEEEEDDDADDDHHFFVYRSLYIYI